MAVGPQKVGGKGAWPLHILRAWAWVRAHPVPHFTRGLPTQGRLGQPLAGKALQALKSAIWGPVCPKGEARGGGRGNLGWRVEVGVEAGSEGRG